MDFKSYPPEVQEYLTALIQRNVISSNGLLSDKTFINYLYSQRLDEDYIESMTNDR